MKIANAKENKIAEMDKPIFNVRHRCWDLSYPS